jgi:hypothetical protein
MWALNIAAARGAPVVEAARKVGEGNAEDFKSETTFK